MILYCLFGYCRKNCAQLGVAPMRMFISVGWKRRVHSRKELPALSTRSKNHLCCQILNAGKRGAIMAPAVSKLRLFRHLIKMTSLKYSCLSAVRKKILKKFDILQKGSCAQIERSFKVSFSRFLVFLQPCALWCFAKFDFCLTQLPKWVVGCESSLPMWIFESLKYFQF